MVPRRKIKNEKVEALLKKSAEGPRVIPKKEKEEFVMPTPEQLAMENIHLFLEHYGITNDQGTRLDFHEHPFLWDPFQDFSPRQAILKAAQVGFCLSPQTRVLTKELQWKTLDEIVPGEQLVSVDENHEGERHGRKMRVSVVEAKKEIRATAFKITLENGSVVTATGPHKFLCKVRGAVHTQWRTVESMRPGDQIRFVVDPWGAPTYEDGWAGGVMDGEGSIRKKTGCELVFVQRPGRVFDRMKEYLEKSNLRFRSVERYKSSFTRNIIGELTLTRTNDIFKFIGITRPSRFVTRTDWWEGTCLPNTETPWPKIISIEEVGMKRMIDIQTSTKTFFAEGLVSHNSTMTNIKALWMAKYMGVDIIYSLPTADDARQFVSGKTNRLIDNNPIFQKWTSDHDTIEQKKIGDNMIYWRGTWVSKAAIMIPADVYISDETDRSNQDTVKLFSSRLQHSKFAWEWYFSNPSAPGVGVDNWWQKSDQKEWFIRCDCGLWQFMTMDNVKPHGVVCTKCGRMLPRKNLGKKGQWVSRWKDRPISGYHISLLMCPWVSAESILEKQTTQSEEQFTNFVLGQPYVGRGNTLTRQLLFANLTDEINSQSDRPIIGVDNGNKITFVVGNKKGLFYNGEVTDFSVLETLMVKFPNAMMCIDPHGNEIATRKLQERFMGRVYRVYSTTPRKSDQVAKWNDQDMTVLIDRDKVIQLVVDEFTERRIPLQGTEVDWHDYWLHWSRIYRTIETNTFGIETYHWAKSDTPCDFPFATFYWRVMMDRFYENSVSFREASAGSFAQNGVEIRPNMHAEFMPKWRIT